MSTLDELLQQLAEIQQQIDAATEAQIDPCDICSTLDCNAVIGDRTQYQTGMISLLCQLNNNLQIIAEAGDLYLRLDGSNQASWTPTATLVPQLNADLLDGQHGSYYAPVSALGDYIKKDGTTITTASIPFALGLSSEAQIVSTLATGTSPLSIASTTLNTNLNADLLDGYHVGTSGAAVPILSASNTWSANQIINNAALILTYSGGNRLQLTPSSTQSSIASGVSIPLLISSVGATTALNATRIQTGTLSGTPTHTLASTSIWAKADLEIDGSLWLDSLAGPALLKIDSNELVQAAVDGTDFLSPTSLTSSAPITFAANDIGFDYSYAGTFLADQTWNGADILIGDGDSIILGDDSDASISHTGAAFNISNATGVTTFSNTDLSAHSGGQQVFSSNWTPTSGTGGSHTGNLFNSLIDWTNITWNTSSTLSGNKFVATYESFDTVSPFPSLVFTGTEFVNNINGNWPGGVGFWSGTALTGVGFDINYTGAWSTVAGFNMFPYIVDVDVTASISGSHQVSGAEFYTTYNAANSTNQLYGVRSLVEARGGVTVAGSFDAFYGTHTLVSGGATLSNDAAVYRAYLNPNYDGFFDAQLASGKRVYGFFADAPAGFNMNARQAAAFATDLVKDDYHFSFLSLGADGWMAADNAAWNFGATATDLSIFSDGTNGIIDVNTALRVGNDITNYVEISSTGDLVFVGSAGLAYGCIHAEDAMETVTISGSGEAAKVQITAFDTNGPSNNTTPDHTNDHITITKAGDYKILVSLTADSVAGGGATFSFDAYKNNGATHLAGIHAHDDFAGGSGETRSLTFGGIVTLAVNDTVEVWVHNETGTENIVIDDINLSAIQLGGGA